MSHIVTVRTEIRDAAAVRAACRRLQLSEPREGVTQLFSGEVCGLAVQLPGWKYPAVCETSTGNICYDTFEGRWGDRRELDRLLQAYAVEKAALESRRRGYSVTEQTLTDGSIKLTIQTGATT